ncbi:MAG: helix-hairpin-helix domain-containing protein [Bacteroidales bacterium]|jgi:hypothetical protein
MIGKKINWCFLFIFYVVTGRNGLTQELNATQQKYIEDAVESMSWSSDEELDMTRLSEDLTYYLSHPVNINSASQEQLEALRFLNDFQIAVILDYREKNGDIYSINELLYLPGFRQQDAELLQAFVYFDRPAEQVRIEKGLISHSRHQVILRYQRVLERQKGFLGIPDSVLELNPGQSRYLGSPDKLYLRYKGSFGNFFSTGIIMEKDAGEEFFRGSNSRGFDYYSAFVSYSNEDGFIRNITLGDYLIRWGQGLLVWNSYSLGKSSYTSDIVRRKSDIKGNLSTDESHFLRGISMAFGKDRFKLYGFFSSRRIDASLSDTAAENFFTSIVETGYHNTPSDISKEKTVRLTSAGSRFQYNGSHLKTGLNGYYLTFDKSLQDSPDLYKRYSFSGKELAGISMDYKYLAGRTQFFGEAARSFGSWAFLNGLFFILRPGIQLVMVHRFYQKGYYSHYANAFGENSTVSNENGFYLGSECHFSNYGLRVYGDIFSFPWIKYNVDVLSEGYDFFLEIDRKIGRADIYFRYRREEKPRNYSSDEKLADVRDLLKQGYRLNGMYFAGDAFRFQSRVEISVSSFDKEKPDYGLMGSQEIVYSGAPFPLELSARIAWFNIPEYNARIYSYERDVLYAFSTYMHYGKGWRFMGMARWDAARFLTFWFRVSQSYYPGKTETGSGLNTISKNHKTDVRLQTIFRF